ncbi:hypothetical protein [Streptomyces herbicida]|uniref:hypothetical protein n=1 Tax=Streptomyces herbicida TaxID=3065675 RepID=UPI0029307B5B|nr:hypothetical protein [Streptomyces sp. NEAU-HV9]
MSWSGLAVVETRHDGMPVLKAITDDARVLLTFPPQHLAEETSRLGDPAPLMLPSGSGSSVPVWRAVLSGPSRLAFAVPRGTSLVPTVDGILEALSRGRPVPAPIPPGAMDTSLELPWRVIFSLENGQPGHEVVSVHPLLPVTLAGVSGLWRARLMSARPGPDAPVEEGSLGLRAVDPGAAGTADPGFSVPLGQAERVRLTSAARVSPAQASRLELSSLGGTLSAKGWWENFQWEHQAVLGRDIRVRTLTSGVLYPLGHRAEYLELSERVFDPLAGNAALLRSIFVLTVTEPVHQPPAEARARRAFPFGEVEITTVSYPDLTEAQWQNYPKPGTGQPLPTYFWPTTPDGHHVKFPVRCATSHGDVRFDLELLFVADLSPDFGSLHDPGLTGKLADVYGQHAVPLPGVPVDLVRTDEHRAGDVQEVHGLTIEGSKTGYRPQLCALEVKLPALRALLDDDVPHEVHFTEAYLREGAAQDVHLETASPLPISFVGRTARSGGLIAPHYVANGISRSQGPIDLGALPDPRTGLIDPGRLFPDDATLLGFALKDLVTDLKAPPQITSVLLPGEQPAVKMAWEGVRLRPSGGFQPTGRSTLDLSVTVTDTGSDTVCTVRDFALVLPSPANPLLQLQFASLSYTHHSGGMPKTEVGGVDVKFLGELQLLEALGDAVDLSDVEPYIDVTPAGLLAHYSLPLPSVTAGAFVLRDFAVNTQVSVPFDGRPVSVAFGFASRRNPFTVTVLMFGGGGFLELELDHTGLRRLEGALEFGAMLAVDFVVARGEVHALGGVRFELAGSNVALSGYLRIGGCVEVLGLVSVSVELCIELAYQSATKALVGRATLVIEIDLTLWSDSVELDSGTWVLAGGGARMREAVLSARAPAGGLERWRAYQAAFVPVPTGDQ